MNFVDLAIYTFVIIIMSLIIYFKIIKTRGQIGCNCSLKDSCSLKIETIESLFEDIKKDFKETT